MPQYDDLNASTRGRVLVSLRQPLDPLPFQPGPLPDELLASWWSRLALLNSLDSDSLGAVLQLDCGRIRLVPNPNEDDPFVTAFATRLGVSKLELLRRCTTRRFWDAFSPDPSRGPIKIRPGLVRPTQNRFFFVCPECVRSDLKGLGFAYLHRIHQLGVGCPMHELACTTSCHRCGRSLLLGVRGLTIVPNVCECRAVIRDTLITAPLSRREIVVANLALSCLNAESHSLSIDLVANLAFEVARKQLNQAPKHNIGKLLKQEFPDSGGRIEDRAWRPTFMIRQEQPCIQKSSLRPIVALMVFAACKVDFNQVQQYVARSKGSPTNPLRPRSPRAVIATLSDARNFVLTYSSKKYLLRICRPEIYWRLILQDPKWLAKWLGSDSVLAHRMWLSRKKMPTKSEDRIIISAPKAKQRALQAAAIARATVRDPKWCRGWRDEKKKIIAHGLDRIALGQALTKARELHLAKPGRPTRWTPTKASLYVGVGKETLYQLSKHDDSLRPLLKENLADHYQRRIKWGLVECGRLGIQLSVRRLSMICGMAISGQRRAMLQQAVEQTKTKNTVN